MAAGLTEAIARRPPRGNGSGDVGANFQQTLSASSVTNIAVLPSGAPTQGGCWVTFVSDVSCFIRFGSAAGSGVAAATTSDALLPAGNVQDFWIAYPEDANMSVIAGGAGNLYRFRSSR